MKTHKKYELLLLCPLLFASAASMGADIGTPDPDVIAKLYPGKTYSPYAQRSFPSNVY